MTFSNTQDSWVDCQRILLKRQAHFMVDTRKLLTPIMQCLFGGRLLSRILIECVLPVLFVRPALRRDGQVSHQRFIGSNELSI